MRYLFILGLLLISCKKKKCDCYNLHQHWANDQWEYTMKTETWKGECKTYNYVYDGSTRYITICE